MKQIHKFYLASFLKNQTYFVPIIVLFFQDLGLSYGQIFWLFTIGSIFAFVIEIPTGILADLYGKKKSIVLSKLLIFIAFIAFGFSYSFWALLLANLIYELGKSFRSGTETAYVYNYLEWKKDQPSYTYIKSNQKFYARISESIGTALGGFIAYKLGFNIVFFLAAIPAFINFVQTLSWQKLPDCQKTKVKNQKNYLFVKKSFLQIFKIPALRTITLNITLFSVAIFSLDKFVQPYMKDVGIDLQYFGIIYSGFLLLVAFLARYANRLEEKFGANNVINYLTLISFVPLIFLAFGQSSILGVVIFFFVLMIENIRSPIANTVFHQNIQSQNRATMGSILELFKSSSKLVFLPIIGYLADWYSMSTAIFVLGGLVLFSSLAFWLREKIVLHEK